MGNVFWGTSLIHYGWCRHNSTNQFILVNKHYDGLMKSGKKEGSSLILWQNNQQNKTDPIIEALSNAMFRIELENGHIVIAHISGKDAYALYQVITW
jgi:hypothetical protein